MEIEKSSKIAKKYYCNNCNYYCSNKYDYNKHLLTAKHNLDRMEIEKSQKVAKTYICVCGKNYKVHSGLWKHKKICETISNSSDNTIDNTEFLKIISQNKDIMDMLILQNENLRKQNEEQNKTIRELIPKIGSNNNNNNQFNLNIFLNEECKDAINFTDFVQQFKVSFDDLENQATLGYVDGISKLFLDNLQCLGTLKRPIHCTDKKRKTLYIKENNEWNKEGSQETLQKGIQEVTRKSRIQLMETKETRQEEYSDADSVFSNTYMQIQRNLIPVMPREVTISKIVENISNNTIIQK